MHAATEELVMTPTVEEKRTVERREPEPAPRAPQAAVKATWPGYAIVAVIALLAGAGGMLAGVRFLGGRVITSSPAAATGAQAATTRPNSVPGMDVSAAGGNQTVEVNAVYISPARQQLIGVRTAPVTHQVLDTTIRTVGTLAYDETRVTQIHTKIAGWVDTLYVDYVGKLVKRGQPLFTIYSPDLVSTQKEYLLALKARSQLGASQFEETRNGADSLVAAARDRLKLWDISDDQIAELERTGEPRKTLTLYSPFGGIVLERNAFAGQYISPEMSTFKIADLSTIWVLGQVFEYELRNIRIGQDAQIQFPYGQSTRTLNGRVTFIYPEIDPETRRAKVRIEFSNPGLEFKPQTYVTVTLKSTGGHQLAIPKEAVIDTGTKQYAILARPNGYFEPREIKIGPPVDEYYPVVSGLETGDSVVTSAQFLVDSETNLQAAMGAMSLTMPGMGGSEKGTETKSVPPPGKADDSMKGMNMSR
jgi:RND family efflux transporter MFP subunit